MTVAGSSVLDRSARTSSIGIRAGRSKSPAPGRSRQTPEAARTAATARRTRPRLTGPVPSSGGERLSYGLADEAQRASEAVALDDLETRGSDHRLDAARGETPEPVRVPPLRHELAGEADLLGSRPIGERVARRRRQQG